MTVDWMEVGYEVALFASGLGIGAFIGLKLHQPASVIPPELLPVDVVSPPEPRRSEPRSSSPSRRISEYAPKPKLARARFERMVASRPEPGSVAPPPQRPQSTEAAVSARLPDIGWGKGT